MLLQCGRRVRSCATGHVWPGTTRRIAPTKSYPPKRHCATRARIQEMLEGAFVCLNLHAQNFHKITANNPENDAVAYFTSNKQTKVAQMFTTQFKTLTPQGSIPEATVRVIALKSLSKERIAKTRLKLPEVAMLGRSNSGKSSLINAVVNKKRVQVELSKKRTLRANLYTLRPESQQNARANPNGVLYRNRRQSTAYTAHERLTSSIVQYR